MKYVLALLLVGTLVFAGCTTAPAPAAPAEDTQPAEESGPAVQEPAEAPAEEQAPFEVESEEELVEDFDLEINEEDFDY